MNIEQQRKLRNERGSGSSQVQTLRAHQCVCVCLHVFHLPFSRVVFYPTCNFPQSRVVGEAGTSGCLTSQTWWKIHIGIFKCSLILVWAHTLHSYTFIIIGVVCTSTKNDLKSLSCCQINIYPYPSYTPTGHLSAASKDSHSHLRAM